MPRPLNEILTLESALIFRITHRDNLAHLAANGLHCASSGMVNPGFVTIGNDDLIARRTERLVPAGPGGALADYVPFYFTPYSPMLYNIKTGFRGVRQRSMSEIVVMVSSLNRLEEMQVRYVVADRHAFLSGAEFWEGRSRCAELPWESWRNRDFKRDSDDPEKFDRYQAEALVYQHLPAGALLGICVYDQPTEELMLAAVASAGLAVPVLRRQEWYV